MDELNEKAASKNHTSDCPPRQNSRCTNNHIPNTGFNQPSSTEKKLVDSAKGAQMSADLVKRQEDFSIIEQVVMQGDLSKLNPEQRVMYYNKVCESAGLNPYTRPFDYIYLNGKLTLYAKKDCTEQLRKLNGISIEELEDKIVDDLYIVKAKAKDKTGRTDESTGAVVIGHLKGEAKANAIMKAETKAKRRVTLSISGMGWTDETEIDSIPNAQTINVDLSTGEIKGQPEQKQTPAPVVQIESKPRLTSQQVNEIQMILDECDEKYKKWVYDYVKKQYKTDDLSGVTCDMYDRMKSAAIKNMEQNYERQRQAHAEKIALESFVEDPELIATEVQ